jgi:hypothetical protein
LDNWTFRFFNILTVRHFNTNNDHFKSTQLTPLLVNACKKSGFSLIILSSHTGTEYDYVVYGCHRGRVNSEVKCYFAVWTVRRLDSSPFRQFAVWTVRRLDSCGSGVVMFFAALRFSDLEKQNWDVTQLVRLDLNLETDAGGRTGAGGR